MRCRSSLGVSGLLTFILGVIICITTLRKPELRKDITDVHLPVERRLGGRQCNGAAEFCGLTLQQFTFATTHNSGATKLSTPASFDGVTGHWFGDWITQPFVGGVLGCFFDNHALDYAEQLQTGVRAFTVDVCKDKVMIGDLTPAEERTVNIMNCHSKDGSPEGSAYGPNIMVSLEAIKAWMTANPSDVVAFGIDNFQMGLGDRLMLMKIEEVFGKCYKQTDLHTLSGWRPVLAKNASASNSPGCLLVDEREEAHSLNDLINHGLRFIYRTTKSQKFAARSYWVTNEYVNSNDNFTGRLDQWAAGLGTEYLKPSAKPKLDVIIMDAFRNYVPDIPNMMPACNAKIAREANEEWLPGEDAEEQYYPPKETKCEGVQCRKLRSRLEHVHMAILNKGYALGGLSIDYSSFGDVKAIVHRMNMVNYRHWKGLKQQGIEWFQLDWVFAIMVIVGVLLGISPCVFVCCCVARHKPEMFPKIMRDCCCNCSKAKRRREKAERKLDRKADKQAEKEANKAWKNTEESQGLNDNAQQPGAQWSAAPAAGWSPPPVQAGGMPQLPYPAAGQAYGKPAANWQNQGAGYGSGYPAPPQQWPASPAQQWPAQPRMPTE